MPGSLNKVVINGLRNEGLNAAISKEYEGIKYLAMEAKDIGMPLDLELRDKLQSSCDTHTQASKNHHSELMTIETELRLKIDDFLVAQAKKP